MCRRNYAWDYCSPAHAKGKSFKFDMTIQNCLLSYPDSGKVRDTWVTESGTLRTTKYDKTVDLGDFCVDRVVADTDDDFTMDRGMDVVALMCDRCVGKVRSFK